MTVTADVGEDRTALNDGFSGPQVPRWLSTLARWWYVPVALAIVGALGASSVGYRAHASAEALISIQSAALDGAGMERTVASAVVELQAAQVFTEAASATGGSAGDLRRRTQVAALTGSQALSITVTAPDEEQAAAEANAIADSGIKVDADRVAQQLSLVTSDTRRLISESKLSNRTAEAARVARLGDVLAANQSSLVSSSRQLSVLQPADPTSHVPGPALLAALGLVGGALAGTVLALALGPRRSTVGSSADLHRLYPDTPVISAADLEAVIGLELGSTSTIVVGGVGETARQLADVVAVVREVTPFDIDVRLTELSDLAPDKARRAEPHHLAVIPTGLNHAMLRVINDNPELLLLIVVRPKATRAKSLEEFGPHLPDRSFFLVKKSVSSSS